MTCYVICNLNTVTEGNMYYKDFLFPRGFQIRQMFYFTKCEKAVQNKP